MKKFITILLGATLTLSLLAGCGKQNTGNLTQDITVVSREDGSGTRGAFVELFGIEEKNAEGKKVDHTTVEAEITNNTSVMMTSISSNPSAIGYISLGSLNDSVKALEIDGAVASVDTIKDGSYKIARPFNIVTGASLSEAATDLINYIMSSEGQQVIEESGYISAAEQASAFSGTNPSGKIVVAGSSSVTPVMQKLKEAYNLLNPDLTVEIQESDSTTGITSTLDGVCDIGMASRDLSDTEVANGLTPTVIAMDGIAVIVNKESSLTGLTSEQIKSIFTGETTNWDEVSESK